MYHRLFAFKERRGTVRTGLFMEKADEVMADSARLYPDTVPILEKLERYPHVCIAPELSGLRGINGEYRGVI